jgi:hypothetical protein
LHSSAIGGRVFTASLSLKTWWTGGDIYHNANHILPEFQNPKPGDSLIGGALDVSEVHPGQWMLGN